MSIWHKYFRKRAMWDTKFTINVNEIYKGVFKDNVNIW